MKFKPGVTLRGIRSELVIGMVVAEQAFVARGGALGELYVTSCTEGKHTSGSLHYTGQAFDCRTQYLTPDRIEAIAEQMRGALGSEWDVLVEATHIHVEFQPKTPAESS